MKTAASGNNNHNIKDTSLWSPLGELCGAVEREYPHTPFRRFARGPPLLSHPMQKNTPGMPP